MIFIIIQNKNINHFLLFKMVDIQIIGINAEYSAYGVKALQHPITIGHQQ